VGNAHEAGADTVIKKFRIYKEPGWKTEVSDPRLMDGPAGMKVGSHMFSQMSQTLWVSVYIPKTPTQAQAKALLTMLVLAGLVPKAYLVLFVRTKQQVEPVIRVFESIGLERYMFSGED